MLKIVSVASCKLAEIAMDFYISKVYGINCKEDEKLFFNISLLLWAYNNGCGDKCKLETAIAKLIGYCRNCKPKKYKEVIIIKNGDYTLWYESQEYLDCLAYELEHNGFITSISNLTNLCGSLNVTINQEQLCQAITVQIAQSGINCNVLATVNMENICNLPTTVLTQLIQSCNSNPQIIQEQLCNTVAQTIIQNTCIIQLS